MQAVFGIRAILGKQMTQGDERGSGWGEGSKLIGETLSHLSLGAQPPAVS